MASISSISSVARKPEPRSRPLLIGSARFIEDPSQAHGVPSGDVFLPDRDRSDVGADEDHDPSDPECLSRFFNFTKYYNETGSAATDGDGDVNMMDTMSEDHSENGSFAASTSTLGTNAPSPSSPPDDDRLSSSPDSTSSPSLTRGKRPRSGDRGGELFTPVDRTQTPVYAPSIHIPSPPRSPSSPSLNYSSSSSTVVPNTPTRTTFNKTMLSPPPFRQSQTLVSSTRTPPFGPPVVIHQHGPVSDALPSPSKKIRILRDADQAREVRKNGACLRCRIGRLKCEPEGTCGSCKSICKKLGSNPDDVCIRKDPSKIVGVQRHRWEWDEGHLIPSSDQYMRDRRYTFVSFTDAPMTVVCLQVSIGQLQLGNGVVHYGIPQQEAPHDLLLEQWAEQQLKLEHHRKLMTTTATATPPDFESTIQQVLIDHANSKCLRRVAEITAAQSPGGCLEPKVQQCVNHVHELMLYLRKMVLAWRVWSAENLFVRRTERSTDAFLIQNHTQPIGDRLRRMAEEILGRVEYEVLRKLDDFMSVWSHCREEKYPVLFQAVNVAVWVSLMVLMLLYRKSLRLRSEAMNRQTYTLAHGPDANMQRRGFLGMTEKLCNAVAVIHGELFRTINVLQSFHDVATDAFGDHLSNSPSVRNLFQVAWASHFGFYANIKNQVTDDVFKMHVVRKEEECFGRKRPVKKALA